MKKDTQGMPNAYDEFESILTAVEIKHGAIFKNHLSKIERIRIALQQKPAVLEGYKFDTSGYVDVSSKSALQSSAVEVANLAHEIALWHVSDNDECGEKARRLIKIITDGAGE